MQILLMHSLRICRIDILKHNALQDRCLSIIQFLIIQGKFQRTQHWILVPLGMWDSGFSVLMKNPMLLV